MLECVCVWTNIQPFLWQHLCLCVCLKNTTFSHDDGDEDDDDFEHCKLQTWNQRGEKRLHFGWVIECLKPKETGKNQQQNQQPQEQQ